MDKRDGKAQFAALREAVSQALRDADPIGLIEGGAPLDEYESHVIWGRTQNPARRIRPLVWTRSSRKYGAL